MVQILPSKKRKTPLRVLGCTRTLLDLALGPGWNENYRNLDTRQRHIAAIRKLLRAGQLSLLVSPIQLAFIHSTIDDCDAPARAHEYVRNLLQWGTSNLQVDYDTALERTNLLAWDNCIDFEDASILVFANVLRVDAVIAHDPEQLAQAATDLPEFFIPIVTPAEFITNIKNEYSDTLNGSKIYAWTPKWRIIELEPESTAIDFAYAIHTAIGNKCIGVLVNGNEVPLNTKLNTGDMVRVLTGDDLSPDVSWLDFAATELARKEIAKGVRKLQTKKGWELIKKFLGDNVRDYVSILDRYSKHHGYTSTDEMMPRVSNGSINLQDIKSWISKNEPAQKLQETKSSENPLEYSKESQQWKLSSCCHPMPGDNIKGICRSHDRPIKVHRENCKKLSKAVQSHIIPMSWKYETCIVTFSLIFQDQTDILRPILNRVIDKCFQPNLRGLHISKDGVGDAVIEICLASRVEWQHFSREIRATPHVQKIIIRKVDPFI